MKIAVVGSRDFYNYRLLKEFISENIDINSISLIVSGGAEGADSLAQKFAKEFGKPILIFYPNWNKYGKQAGMLRNIKIVKSSDTVFAFWKNKSRGTKNSIDLAHKYGKMVHIVEEN